MQVVLSKSEIFKTKIDQDTFCLQVSPFSFAQFYCFVVRVDRTANTVATTFDQWSAYRVLKPELAYKPIPSF